MAIEIACTRHYKKTQIKNLSYTHFLCNFAYTLILKNNTHSFFLTK